MRRLILVMTATVLMASQAAYGAVDDVARVKRLLQICNQPAGPKTAIQGIDGGICLGYISGVMETFDMLERICVPKLSPGVDPTLPIIGYLNAHSEMQDWLAPIAILMAAEKTFPCAKR
jgi:hypothetical protein